jgi:hypothetical protein
MKTEISEGCPQGPCCDSGLWNIQYNSLQNLSFTRRTKAVAFADDLILVTRGKTVREAENFTNFEMSTITSWAKSNKIKFNEE